MIKAKNLAPDLRAVINGMMVGNVYYVGTGGDDNVSGKDYTSRMKSIKAAAKRLVSANNDYILCFGSETGTGSIDISAANAHIIGCSMPISDSMGRGYAYTCPATVDTIIPTTAADYLEIANIRFACHATDHILIDDAGCDDAFFHHNTVYGSTTASDAIRLDIEGARWSICDNIFVLCKLPIDLAGAACVVMRNFLHDVDTGAKGIVFGANAHYGIFAENVVNLSGGTGDVGVTIASSADNIVLRNNMFHGSISDAISDSGTGTGMWLNYTTAIDGTSGASLPKPVIN